MPYPVHWPSRWLTSPSFSPSAKPSLNTSSLWPGRLLPSSQPPTFFATASGELSGSKARKASVRRRPMSGKG